MKLKHGKNQVRLHFFHRESVIYDALGSDSIHIRHTHTVFQYCKDCDVMIYVTYYNHSFLKNSVFLNFKQTFDQFVSEDLVGSAFQSVDRTLEDIYEAMGESIQMANASIQE